MTHEELLLFGERLRGRRNSLGYTQEYISDKIGISLRFYQMIERGEKSVSLDTLIRLSRTLAVSMDYLLLGDVSGSLANPILDTLAGLSPASGKMPRRLYVCTQRHVRGSRRKAGRQQL